MAVQYKLVPFIHSECPHDSITADGERVDTRYCLRCGVSFIKIVYETWQMLGSPLYCFRRNGFDPEWSVDSARHRLERAREYIWNTATHAGKYGETTDADYMLESGADKVASDIIVAAMLVLDAEKRLRDSCKE